MIYFYVSLMTYMCYCIIKYRESLYYLEKSKYDNKKYGQIISKNISKILINPELLFIILIIIAFNLDIKVLEISTIITYMILFIYKLKTNNKDLKITKQTTIRVIGILTIYLLLNIWFCIDYNHYHSAEIIFDNTPLYYIILYIVTYLSYFIVYIINMLLKPIDKLIK